MRALLALALLGCSASPVKSASAKVDVRAVGCIAIGATDLERSRAFYAMLGFREAHGHLVLGRECVDLRPAATPVPADSQSNDRWFQHIAIVVSDMGRAFALLESNGVPHASVAPQTLPEWNTGAANIRAYYFKDPANHTLEIIWYPPDKGQPRWHAHEPDALFLGIDHTAIVVADTKASLGFYEGTLGLRVVGSGENYGPEQERLNNVPGARLRITTLRAADGPGIELLEYVSPKTGRGARPSDPIQWRTRLYVDDRTAGTAIRDPDGHFMELVSR